ncbi:MAG: hydrogenase formation protein HypD [Nitrospirota bacterium]|nr:hydrogenase formation protein HypD [Nitrospirota bacterium]
MKYVDEFRQRDGARAIMKKILEISGRPATIMEICGTHTHAISRFGIREALPSHIRLVSGPGCPVCVTSASDVNRVIEFSRRQEEVILATFGDMMKVPGSDSSLQEERAAGADVRVVYSPLGALDIARANPGRQVIFYGVGFETTVPAIAATILMARAEGLGNYSVLAYPKLTPPAMKGLLDSGSMQIDGFLCPGHVTAIIGAEAYGFIARDYGAPCVVAGFEPLDALYGIYMLIRQLEEGRKDIEIQYSRVVTWEGNEKARRVMEQVFEVCDADWRGIRTIPMSGMKIRLEFAAFDAERRFDIGAGTGNEPAGCRCGEVLRGLIVPPECNLFGEACTPESPAGPCMVSSEGTCAAYYKYGGAVLMTGEHET